MKPEESHIILAKEMKVRWGIPAKVIKFYDEYKIRSIAIGIFGSGEKTIWCTIGNYERPLGCELALRGKSDKIGNYLSSSAFILWQNNDNGIITAEDAGLINGNSNSRHAFYARNVITDFQLKDRSVPIAAGILGGDKTSDESVGIDILKKWGMG